MCVLCFVRPGTKRRLMNGENVHWIYGHKTRSDYLLSAVLSAPLWVRSSDFDKLRERKAFLERMTGEKHHFDHKTPLNGPKVRIGDYYGPLFNGLTVPWNMEVVPAKSNMSKGNSWTYGQADLFNQPEQLSIQL